MATAIAAAVGTHPAHPSWEALLRAGVLPPQLLGPKVAAKALGAVSARDRSNHRHRGPVISESKSQPYSTRQPREATAPPPLCIGRVQRRRLIACKCSSNAKECYSHGAISRAAQLGAPPTPASRETVSTAKLRRRNYSSGSRGHRQRPPRWCDARGASLQVVQTTLWHRGENFLGNLSQPRRSQS